MTAYRANGFHIPTRNEPLTPWMGVMFEHLIPRNVSKSIHLFMKPDNLLSCLAFSQSYPLPNTVIPRLTKIIRSGITFVSRNVMLSDVSLLAVSNVNNPVGLVGLPYVMWSAHFFVTHTDGKDKLLEWPDRSCLLLYVSARIH